MVPGIGVAGAVRETNGTELAGKPDGPDKYIDSLGVTVPTFIDPCDHMRLPKDSGTTWLMYHVPRNMRGYYRPEHYNEKFAAENKQWILDLTLDNKGYVRCVETTLAGNPCARRAVNFSGLCQAHGGKLHPLDKVVDVRRDAMVDDLPPDHGFAQSVKTRHAQMTPELLGRMTRWQMLLSGIITVEDLDDEELQRRQCRDRNGGFTGEAPRQIPKKLADQLVRKLFERVDEKMKTNLMDMVQVMIDIATSDVYEAADRIKAAQWVSERQLGKVPDKVIHVQEKPWEMVLSGITGGSRAASRVARGVADEEEILEAQLVEIEEVPQSVTQIVEEDEYDPDDPVQNPDALLELEPDPITDPSFKPGEDPYLLARDPYDAANEVFRKEEKRKEIIALRKELSEKRKAHQRQRYVARAQGFDQIAPVPFEIKSTQRKDGWHHKFSLPKIVVSKRRVDFDR